MKARILTRDDGKVLVDVTCGPGETGDAFDLALSEYQKLKPLDVRPEVSIKIDNGKTDCLPCGYVMVVTK